MKTVPTDSPTSPGDADAGELQELVRTTRSRTPSPDAVQRIAKRLVAAGALDPASPSETSRVAGPTATARVANKVGYYYKAGAFALAVAAGSLLAWRATSTSTSVEAPLIAPAAGPATQERVGPSGNMPNTGAPEARPASGTGDSAPKRGGDAIAAVSIDALPSAAPKPRAATAGSDSTPHRASEGSTAKTSTPELLLVRRAQDALTSNPARALSLADEHAALFPSGELTQEREVVAVDALSKLGRKDDALLRARAVLRRFPRTSPTWRRPSVNR